MIITQKDKAELMLFIEAARIKTKRSFNARMEQAGIQIIREPDKTVWLEHNGKRVKRPDHVNNIEAYCLKHFNLEI